MHKFPILLNIIQQIFSGYRSVIRLKKFAPRLFCAYCTKSGLKFRQFAYWDFPRYARVRASGRQKAGGNAFFLGHFAQDGTIY